MYDLTTFIVFIFGMVVAFFLGGMVAWNVSRRDVHSFYKQQIESQLKAAKERDSRDNLERGDE